MKVILVDQRHGHTRTIILKGWLKGLLSICILGAPVALGYLGYHVAVSQDSREYSLESALGRTDEIESQADALARLRQESAEQLEALTARLATLQARLLRFEALEEDSVAYHPPGFTAGQPGRQGWISSPFPTDPVTGRLASQYSMASGASEAGADIASVTATRYEHAESPLVDASDVIVKGQTIALLGSTGRSIGPHAHFEAYKNGRVVDPASYIHRTPR